jgi:hypothetical protein
MEETTALALNGNTFIFDLHSTFKPRTTAKCHNAYALKKDYRTFAKKVYEIVEYLSGIELMHSIPDHVNEHVRSFVEVTEEFVDIISTSLSGIVCSEREEIEESIKRKTRNLNGDKKKELANALNIDEIFVESICNSFNNIVDKMNDCMNNIDELLDEEKITKPVLDGLLAEIKTIASLSLGNHCVLCNLVASMSKYKMNYQDGKLVICCTGTKKDTQTFEKV